MAMAAVTSSTSYQDELKRVYDSWCSNGQKVALKISDDHFLPNTTSVMKLYKIVEGILVSQKLGNFKISEMRGSFPYATKEVIHEGCLQVYRMAIRNTIAKRFVASLPEFMSKLFYCIVAKVYQETTFDNLPEYPNFPEYLESCGRKIFNEFSGSSMIIKSIAIYCRVFSIQYVHLMLLGSNLKDLDDEAQRSIQSDYASSLIEKDRLAIERLICKYKCETPLVSFFKALEKYIDQVPLNTEPNFSRLCDESLKPPCFKIQDLSGNIRGHLLGIIQQIPKKYSKLPQEIQSALFHSNAFSMESIDPTISISDITNIHDNFNRNSSSCFLNILLAYKAAKLGKPILSLGQNPELKYLSVPQKTQDGEALNPLLNQESQRWISGDLYHANLKIICKLLQFAGCSEHEIDKLKNQGRIETIKELFLQLLPEQREPYNQIVAYKNIGFSNKIDELLKKFPHSKIFFVLEDRHLPDDFGEGGVLSLLRRKNWRLTPVK